MGYLFPWQIHIIKAWANENCKIFTPSQVLNFFLLFLARIYKAEAGCIWCIDQWAAWCPAQPIRGLHRQVLHPASSSMEPCNCGISVGGFNFNIDIQHHLHHLINILREAQRSNFGTTIMILWNGFGREAFQNNLRKVPNDEGGGSKLKIIVFLLDQNINSHFQLV